MSHSQGENTGPGQLKYFQYFSLFYVFSMTGNMFSMFFQTYVNVDRLLNGKALLDCVQNSVILDL